MASIFARMGHGCERNELMIFRCSLMKSRRSTFLEVLCRAGIDDMLSALLLPETLLQMDKKKHANFTINSIKFLYSDFYLEFCMNLCLVINSCSVMLDPLSLLLSSLAAFKKCVSFIQISE